MNSHNESPNDALCTLSWILSRLRENEESLGFYTVKGFKFINFGMGFEICQSVPRYTTNLAS